MTNVIELAARLEAEDKLKARGFRKTVCSHCGGSGEFKANDVRRISIDCRWCEGKGIVWVAPPNY